MDKEIIKRVSRGLTKDCNYIKECISYDGMDEMLWNPPDSISDKDWIYKSVSPFAYNSLKTAANMFDTYNPKWHILPRGPEDEDAAEELERWLEWQMILSNRMGDEEPFRKMLKHSVKYDRICVQLEYLPYWVNKDSENYKELMDNGPFCITVHTPATVHYEMGKYALRWVASVNNIPAADVIDHWKQYESDGREGKKIKTALSKIEDLLEEDEEARVIYVDYTSNEKRYVCAYLTTGTSIPEELDYEPADLIEIVNTGNELKFIPWVVVKGTSNSILYPLYKGNLWSHQNLLDTLANALVERRAFWPYFTHTSSTGKPLEVDFTGAEAVIELGPGEANNVNIPPPLDSGIREIKAVNSQEMANSTGVSKLQSLDIAGNVQFATMNAYIQIQKTALEPYVKNFEKAATALGRMMFQWIKYTGDTVTSYRSKTRDATKGKVRGQKINIGPDDFDPKSLMVTCELMANTPTDEMQKVNMYSQMINGRWPIPKSEFIERMNFGSPEPLKAAWEKEEVESAQLEAFKQMLVAQTSMMLQQMQGALQQQMQPQGQAAPPQGGPPQPAFDQAQGQGFNPGQQGSSPMEAAPQMSQTQTGGQSATGQGIA